MKKYFDINSLVLVAFALFFTACASKNPIANKPLKDDENYLVKLHDPMKSDDLSLVLTFSGGGTRAAAFSYGVLKALKNTKVDDETLLSKVDVISSVSGGSFTAAYYGLYQDRIFHDFEEKFLKKKVQSVIIDTLLSPLNWGDFFKRSELVSKYYEDEIFENKKFKDIRRDGPAIVINATDLSTGNAFSFTPENFRRICSDISEYPIGRAVTASSAVPILFSPLTLKNYDTCKPLHSAIREVNHSKITRNNKLDLNMRKYLDKENYPYLHLIDGGIADNLGIRPLLQVFSEYDNDLLKVLDLYGMDNTKKVVFIVVNAADSISPKIALKKENPDIPTTMGAVSTIQLQRYNIDTLDLLSNNFKKWEKELTKNRCKKQNDCEPVKFYLIELNFNQLPNHQAKKFSLIETSLELPDKKVDELVKAGNDLLLQSELFQKLLKELKEK